MPFKYTNDDGQEVEAFTKEEKDAELQQELQAKEEEIEKFKKINAERGENFKRLSEMTEAEKAARSANEIEFLKRMDEEREQREKLEKELMEYKNNQINSTKENIFQKFHKGDATIKQAIEEKYNIINLPDSTPQEMEVRMMEAAKLAGVQIQQQNPIYTHMSGEAPQYNDSKEYVETPEGKTAYEAYQQFKNNQGANHF